MHGIIFNFGTSMGTARTVGPYLIATHLRSEGWNIEVVDFAIEWTLEELKELIKIRLNNHSKFIGISHQFSFWSNTLDFFCKFIKEKYPHIIIISGHSSHPHYSNNIVDYHIQGYGEYAVSALLKYLFSNGEPIKLSPFSKGAKRNISANDFYPAYPKSSLLALYEKRDFIIEEEWLTTELSRGCKFACDFCNFPVLGVKGDYTRTAENFEFEMKYNFDNFGVKNYIIADETVNDSTEKIRKYANVVDKLNFVPFYTAFVRGDLLVSRPQDKDEMLKMNLLGHWYGLDTFNKQSGKAMGKGMDPEKLQNGILSAKDYFLNNGRKLYRASISLVVGLPYETTESIEATRTWLFKKWQGQAFSTYALQIPTSKTDTFSKISKDYKKYGYESMSELEIEKYLSDPAGYTYRTVGITPDYLLWKNKEMNLHMAEKLATYIDSIDKIGEFTLDPWSLGSLGFSGTVEERLDVKKHNELARKYLYNQRVKNYIQSKLNYIE
jgi:radical SAM superfamily enzyme YgiQ (UPF0313 family)